MTANSNASATDIAKQAMLNEIGTKWSKFSKQELSALKTNDELVSQVVAVVIQMTPTGDGAERRDYQGRGRLYFPGRDAECAGQRRAMRARVPSRIEVRVGLE